MKVRLVKGPFGGKVVKHPQAGRNSIIMQGPKPMSRKQRYEWEMEQYQNRSYGIFSPLAVPTVRAEYQIAMRPQGNGTTIMMLPCMHPDGSIFYEYVEDSKKEYPR